MNERRHAPIPDVASYERALIGAVLVGYRDLAELRRLVTPADFDQPSLGMIWQAIIRVWEEGRTPEPLAVWEALGEWRRRIGQGPVVLHDLMAEAAAPVQAPWYAERVADAARRRRIAETGARLSQLAMLDRPAEELVEDARATLDELSLRGGRAGPQVAADVMADVMDELQSERPPALGTPWADLDRVTGGLRPGTVVVIGARTSVGKSLMATNLLAHAALRHGRPSYMASLEMGRTEVMARVISSEARIELNRLMDRQLTEADWERISGVHARLAAAPMVIDDSSRMTVGAIRAGIRDVSRDGPPALAIVDYLQLVQPRDPRANREQQVAEISRQLKIISREMNTCVIAVAQLNRASLQRQRPGLADLRESGAIEQDADQVWLLHMDPEEGGNAVDVIVAKNRNGQVGEVKLFRQGHYSRMLPLASREG